MEILKLIINADDYGMSPIFNKGILELAKRNIISSISVMIKKDFVNFFDLKKLKNISIGLHLTLKKNGSTLPEIELQIKKFKNIFKKYPSHLDSHYHLHLNESNFKNIIEISKKYQLPIRSRFKKDRLEIKKYSIKTPDKFISWHPNRIANLEKKISQFKNGVLEMVCHPGYYDKNSTYSYNECRKQELDFLKSAQFKQLVKKFELINYNEL